MFLSTWLSAAELGDYSPSSDLSLSIRKAAESVNVGAVEILAIPKHRLHNRQHGAYARTTSSLAKRTSRTAVKQQIIRLRVGLRLAFHKAGLSLDPGRILVLGGHANK
jgi:hypothetical protein